MANDQARKDLVISERADFIMAGVFGILALAYPVYLAGEFFSREEEFSYLVLVVLGTLCVFLVCGIYLTALAGYKIEWRFTPDGSVSTTRTVWGVRMGVETKNLALPLDTKITGMRVRLGREYHIDLSTRDPIGSVSVGRFGTEEDAVGHLAKLNDFYTGSPGT